MIGTGAQTDAFLSRAGWSAARRSPLAGDASGRRYFRLETDAASAVLMQAPPDSLGPFLAIDGHLRGLGLSAPAILAADRPAGLLLLEDLGDSLFARLLEAAPEREAALYRTATDLLLTLRTAPHPTAPDYGAEAMVAATDLAHEHYGRIAIGAADPAHKATSAAALSDAFARLPPWTPTLALRDFHAENLFWLPNRAGLARVGLIDFQDAVLSHPLYDLVSLLRDVRRDVSPATQSALLRHWAEATGESMQDLTAAAALIGAQRNLRILGVFTRLAVEACKPGYLALLPRTWAKLTEDLAHPSLAPLRDILGRSLPPPTPDLLARIASACHSRQP